MNYRYIIYSNHPDQKVIPVYYESTTFKSSDWDTYGSQPAKTIKWSALVREAKLFGTRVEALDVVERDIEEQHSVDINCIHVVRITDKQLFKAKLAEK